MQSTPFYTSVIFSKNYRFMDDLFLLIFRSFVEILSKKMTISKTNFVQAHYRLREDNQEGAVIEETFDKEPLGFVYGVGMMIPGFESEIEGLSIGDKKGFAVVAENAYGLYNDDNLVSIPIENFGDEETRAEHLIEGKQIALQDNTGQQHVGTVKAVEEDHAKIDFNHPMAGNDLFFEVEIISIRETTSDELAQMGLNFEG